MAGCNGLKYRVAALPVDLETKQRLLEMDDAYSRFGAEADILFAGVRRRAPHAGRII